MKRIVLMCLVALVLPLVSACGSAAPAAPTVAAATQSSTAASGEPTQVEVTLADNTISSSVTTFNVGVAYTFVIKNNGNHQHNFNINQPVSVTGSQDASLKSALLTVPEEQLPIGGGTTVQYTFPPSAAGTTLEFSCLIRRHYDLGMRLAITVAN